MNLEDCSLVMSVKCEPMLSLSLQKSSIPLNHALQMTFGAPVEALYGSDITLPPLPKRRRRIDLEEASHSGSGGTGVTVPHVLQGEIARLQSHFKVILF
jgi:hypothetical protein